MDENTVTTPNPNPNSAGTKRRSIWSRLYNGETDFNIVGRWKLWFVTSSVLILIGLVALAIGGLNLGIDFTGGTVWEVPAGKAKVADVEAAVRDLGYNDVQVQEVTQSAGGTSTRVIRVEAEATATPTKATTDALARIDRDLASLAADVKGKPRAGLEQVRSTLDGVEGPFQDDVPDQLASLQKRADDLAAALPDAKDSAAVVTSATEAMKADAEAIVALEQDERERVGRAVTEALAEQTGSKATEVTVDTVGPSWGEQISQKARTALIVFLLAIMAYITIRFEFRMAVSTVAALIHDLLIVVGLYAVFQFPVTPATVIAVLTILGFSIYDGIVVFDRVDENTALLGRRSKLTYTQMANMSLNQVLMRSLNTSITALLPIFTVLVLGSFVLGATTLEEFGLALFLGLLSGAYSSIFIATPMLAVLKEREPRYRELREKIATSSQGEDLGDVTMPVGGGVATDIEPRARKQGKRR
jgi:preprotein translocase subunit SecF